MRFLLVVFIFVIQFTFAAPLESLVTVNDGLNNDDPNNISDDYIRLTLTKPSYATATEIQNRVTDFLGPGLVEVRSNALVFIQAPRSPSERVAFIAALMTLDIPIPTNE